MKTKLYILLAAFSALPLSVSAQTPVDTLIGSIKSWVSLATPVVVGIALLAFFWGLAKYIFNADSEDAKKSGVRIMVGGAIALFVMISVWGLVSFVSDALIGDTPKQPFRTPCINDLC